MRGERVGLPAVEVLSQVAEDLKLAHGKGALSYDRLRAAMKLFTGTVGTNASAALEPRRLAHHRKDFCTMLVLLFTGSIN